MLWLKSKKKQTLATTALHTNPHRRSSLVRSDDSFWQAVITRRSSSAAAAERRLEAWAALQPEKAMSSQVGNLLTRASPQG